MSKKQKITVGQILDLVDYNRNGEGMTIKISESDDNWSITQTNSVMLEMIKDFEMRLRSQGLDMNTYMQYMGMDVNALRGMYKEDAEKRVKLRLALETIAKKENIEVTEADLDEEYGKIAETYKMDVEKVKESVPADSLSEDVKVQKALNLVKDNANIK